ncbi:HlyD family type I secretion periplasmic adaptor subunit [Methylotuvimicrobium alcaliphilum]|uniref:Membrane fusion protein (MFP) family protein n=1 Tax=Methylotuvimicrobium alcaliphilum (strain DSM 19304 / NCIMB 14124 / VKM B-2133 / 20Z) TaxID=1091494 RepID=G4T3W0_META2|nr:HlyD family type I secretion periplasmic adaptor subunit [Methylotuvimicrobium alcaliphilum]CCE22659.1 Type I secretion membrane fusion protein [Methylotuvimicrobium alcaliphilum 20Z]
MSENSALINAEPTALHTDDKPIRLIGAIIVLATFGVFGGWAFLAPLDSSALATGVVVVKSYKKTVQHLDGGIVDRILAQDGDLVQAGQLLVILDDTQIKAQLGIAYSQKIALAAQVARLEAERDLLPEIVFPDFLETPVDPRAIEATQAERNVFRARKNAYQGEIAVLEQRIGQIKSKINGLRSQIASKQILVKSYAEEIKDLQELLAEGFADRQRLRDLERSHAQQTGEIAQLQSEVATNEIQISETRLQILQTQKQFQQDVVTKLSEAKAALNDAEERVTANRDKLDRIAIKAPATGMVLGLSVHTEGGVIVPGDPILDIVPKDVELIIEARVSPLDIDRVSVGLQSEVRFSAFKQATTPKMEGKVIHLSADSFIDERTGESYYQAHIELTPESQIDLGELQLLPGMPVEVLINTGERTLVEYLSQPITNAIARSFIED